MSARNKADPDPGWDHHEAIIKSLYVERKVKLGDLIKIMATSHRFRKTKSQYESQFKIWGIRKYRKIEDWKSIGRNIAERRRAGKESRVYIDGELIPKSRVQKQTSRHAFTTALERNLPAPIPSIPDGFEIRTPPAIEIVPLPTLPGGIPSSPIGMQTRFCASPRLQIVSSALPSQTVTSDASLDVLWTTMSSSPPIVQTDLSLVQSQNAMDPTIYSPGMYESFGFVFEDVDESFRPLKLVWNLPFCELEDGLIAQIEPSLISTNAQIFGFKSTPETISLPEHHHNDFSKDADILCKVLNGSQSLTAVIKALLPSTVRVSQEEDQVILSPNHHRSDSAHYKLFSLLIFAMANSFAGLNSVPIKEIRDFLSRQASTRLLQHILNTSGPESEAFAESLFRTAILMQDARIVKVLLQKGLSLNDLVCIDGGVTYTPLEYSSMVRNVEVTRLLLDAKLDVNRSISGEKYPKSAIACAIKGLYRLSYRGVPFELVDMLLKAGCNFSWQYISFPPLQDNRKVLDLLLDTAFKTKTYEQAWFRFVECLSDFNNSMATRLYTRFLEEDVIVNHNIQLNIHGKNYLLIDFAAQCGNLELVQLLLRSRVSSTSKTLACAIGSRNKELVRFLLDHVADFFDFEESATEDWYDGEKFSSPPRSLLSEATRWKGAEALDLLEKDGACSQIVNNVTDPWKFEQVLTAASVRGQLPIVQKLLSSRPPDARGEDLGNALLVAISANDEAIVLALLNAGADVNQAYNGRDAVFGKASDLIGGTNKDKCLYFGVKALELALGQKNEKLVRLILDADVDIGFGAKSGDHSDRRDVSDFGALELAVKWGSIPIIRELISMGISMKGSALAISIQEKNTECMYLLLNAGAEVSSEALKAAVTNNDIQMVEYLLSVGADPANTEALDEALPHGLPMIETLLTAFAGRHPHGKDGYGIDAFIQAIQKGDSALVKVLLDANVNVQTLFRLEHSRLYICGSLLGTAIILQHASNFAILQMLLGEVENPNIVVQAYRDYPYHRATALLTAIDTKDIKKVQLLIDARANVNWPATKGVKRTPIQRSVEIGSYEITNLLIDKGGLVNNEPAVRGGATALQLAAIGGYIGIAQLLLENGADVNAPSAKIYGRTALEGAAEHGRIDMLKLLCNAGAKFRGNEYEKARELAKEKGHMATWRYLEHLYPPSETIFMDT